MFRGIRKHWEIAREAWRADRISRADKAVQREAAFLPAALEILETPPNPLGRGVLIGLAAFVAIAIVWACVGKVDVVAVAPGKIVPRGQVKVIQAADLGVVRAINVTEGAHVKAGQPLIVLDPTVTGAEVEQARQAELNAEIDMARAKALVSYAQGHGGAFQIPAGTTAADTGSDADLVRAKISEHASATAAARAEAEQRARDHDMVAAEVEKLSQQLPLAERQLASLETLQAKGYAAGMRVDEVRERVVGMRQDLAIRRAEMAKARAATSAARQQVARLNSEFEREALDALTEAKASEALRAEETKKADEKASLTILRAPTDGVVAQLAVHTVGAVVKPADALLVVVPVGSDLMVEARVLNRDAGFVREGQPVQVKLEAFPFTRYGVVHGAIEHISRDAVDDEDRGLVFTTLVRLPKPWLTIADHRSLLAPGLAATAEIRTGERRVIEYLLSPLARRVKEAGRER
jgi:hemolysin D